MINLFDFYTVESKDLQFSQLVAGQKYPTVVLHDDGFLPDDVTSPLKYYLRLAGEELVGKPRYFNQIDLPRYWAIEASGSGGKLMDMGLQRGRITFATTDNSRPVKTVEWFDRNGRVRVVDHYNQWGFKHAVTDYDEAGHPTLTTYLTRAGQEIVVSNHLTGQLVYYQPNGQPRFFNNQIEIIAYYLQQADLDIRQINFNSLSTPLFVVQKLGAAVKHPRLFWQEPLQDAIPGNMQFILNGNLGPNAEIVVQTKAAYDNLRRLVADQPQQQVQLSYLGYAYPFQRLNKERKEILILTNSDQLVEIESLIKGLPDFHFAIAAVTEMSSKLMSLDHYANVDLYPTVATKTVRELVAHADVYLDINRGNEILDAVRGAFENNMLIMGFEETLHAPRYVAPVNRYQPAQVDQMVADLQAVFAPGDQLENRLQAQWQAADRVLPDVYRDFFAKH